MQSSEVENHFHPSSRPIQSKDLKRLSTVSLRRDKNYLSHVPNTSIGQPVAKHETFHDHISQNSHKSQQDRQRSVESSNAGPLSRKTCLYNKCSEGYVSMSGPSIFANETECSSNAELELQSVGQGRDRRPVFTIRGLSAKKFICFNKHGRIVTKSRGHHRFCRFQELINSMYTVYQSEANDDWFLSFDKHGRRSSLSSQLLRRDPMKCRRFISRILPSGSSQPSDDSRDLQSSSGFDAESKKLETLEQHKDRVLRRHHRHNRSRRHHSSHIQNSDETKL